MDIGSYDKMSDEEIALLCRKEPDNMDHISVLIRRYMPMIRKRAAHYANFSISADDLSQEAQLAFIKAVEKYDSSRDSVFSAYVFSCVNNRIISVLRKINAVGSGEELCDEVSAPDEMSDPESIYVEREFYKEISSLLTQRELDIFKAYLDGATYKEIAAELGISVKSVDNGILRMRKKLKSAVIDMP